MFIAAIFVLSLLVVWADWVAYKRYVASLTCAFWRRVAIAAIVVANILPYIATGLLYLCEMPSIVPMMWLLTIYILLTFARQALYVGILLVRHRYIKWVVGTILCTIVAWILIVGVVRTRKELVVKQTHIVSHRLPKAFDGYRIAFFSDLHIGSLTSADKMCENLVAKINALDADLVVFGGDLVNARYDELTEELAAILGRTEARDGVVAILGNHDTGVYVRDTVALPIEENTRLLVARIESMRWSVVDDATEELVRGNDTITLTGIGFSRELLEHRHSAEVADSLDLRPIFDGVPRGKFNITLSHMPQLWRKVAALGYGDLVLSGHVHSMQIKGRIGRYSFSPAQLMYREWSGLYKENDSYLYITDGIGSVGFHLRLGAPPEISLLTLHSKSD